MCDTQFSQNYCCRITERLLNNYNGCTAPAIKTKNVSSDPVCENAIAQDATILQDFRTCFEAKNFTLPTVTALAYPPFNVQKYSQSNLKSTVKNSCTNAASQKKRLVKKCLNALFSGNSLADQNSETVKIKKIFRLKKESCS
uniref:Uncharacterized protein n=1 Tax=Romanomermis culicivorax TaxID=13658 RepID=A0A915KT39_ROMCU